MRSLLGLAVAGLLATTAAANATLMISADINGTTFTCSDNEASCDTNPATGTLQIANQTVAGVEFLGSSQIQVIGPTNSLDSSSFQFINTNATPVALQLAVSGTDFEGPVTSFSASGSGTFQSAIGSTVDLTYFGDPANTQGATTPTDLPGSLLADSGVIDATLETDSFSFNTNGPFDAAGPYSMSLATTVELAPGGSLVGRSQAIVTSVVPEPGSAALVGFGFLVVAWLNWRQRRGGAI